MKDELKLILVVEDDFSQQEKYVDMLTDSGYEVRGAGDADQATEVFDEFQPDLVLMDINMDNASPKTDGIGIAGILRSRQNPFALVFMTGYGKEDYDFKHTKHLDPHGFLRKTDAHNRGALYDRLEVAWNNYLISNRRWQNITPSKKVGEQSINTVLVLIEEFLIKGGIAPQLQPCKKYVKVLDIILLERVGGENKKQVKLFMKDGSVYRVSKNLSPFIDSLNQNCIVQINGSVAINAKMVKNVTLEDGEEFIVMPELYKKFHTYSNLPRKHPDKLTSAKLFMTRTYKKRGALQQINSF